MCLRPLRKNFHLCLKQRFYMQAKRVRPHEFTLIHLHGLLSASPRPDSQLPRPRENWLTNITESYRCCAE